MVNLSTQTAIAVHCAVMADVNECAVWHATGARHPEQRLCSSHGSSCTKFLPVSVKPGQQAPTSHLPQRPQAPCALQRPWKAGFFAGFNKLLAVQITDT